DVMVTKLNALTEHTLEYRGLLETARALREQICGPEVAERVAGSPFARAFLYLTRELHIIGEVETERAPEGEVETERAPEGEVETERAPEGEVETERAAEGDRAST